MDTRKLRSKRVLLPAIAAVAVLGTGGMAWTATASDDLNGSVRDRVGNAAVKAVGGTVVEVEASDDRGEAYEVEVRLDDGTEIDVALDHDLNVVSQEREASEASEGSEGTEGSEDSPDADDRALSSSERASAEKAALSAVDGGTVDEVEASDDRGEAYEVDVRDAQNTEWEVVLDAGFHVLSKSIDD